MKIRRELCGQVKKIITGLSLNGDRIFVPRKYKRNLRNEINYIRKFGIVEHCEKIGVKDPLYLERILGKLRFWLQVEPENYFANSALAEFKSDENSWLERNPGL